MYRVLPLLVLLPLLLASPAAGQTPTSSASTAATSWSLEVPLPPLPKLPSKKLPPLQKASVEQLDVRLSRLMALKVEGPLDQIDLAFLIEEVDEPLVVAIAARLKELREDLSGKRVRRILERARKDGRRAIRKAKKKTGKEPNGDWLVFLLARPQQSKRAWIDGVQLFGMLRMLEGAGSHIAMREIIAAYAYFGEIVRIDLQRAIARLGDKAVAALIEAKQHKAKRVRRWARRRLDNMGRAIPGEAVAIKDPAILVHVLHAFGRIREVDATRVLLSYAGSERSQLRDAARSAIGAIGEPTRWYLRDAYQSQTGKRTPRSWSWKRTAQELFRLHELASMKPVHTLLRTGRQALDNKDYVKATQAFDEALRRVPRLVGAPSMAPAYRGLADELLAKNKKAEALAALRKARVLDPTSSEDKKVASQITELEARLRLSEGQPDRYLLERATKLDPENEDAKALLTQTQGEKQSVPLLSRKQVAPLLILLGILGSALFLRRPRTVDHDSAVSEPTTTPGTQPDADPPGAESPDADSPDADPPGAESPGADPPDADSPDTDP